MLILAIDSATQVAGVALLDDSKLLKEEFSNFKRNHAEILMPMVDRVLQECGFKSADLDAVAVTVGPGSFTGLRIGMATAKGICMAGGVSLVGVSTLETLAWNLAGSRSLICPMLDARKGEIYAGLYKVIGGEPQSIYPDGAYAPDTFIDVIREKTAEFENYQCTILGDAVQRYGELFRSNLRSVIDQPPAHLILPRASALADLGARKFARGEVEELFSMRPVYLRLSEAEIKRRAKEK